MELTIKLSVQKVDLRYFMNAILSMDSDSVIYAYNGDFHAPNGALECQPISSVDELVDAIEQSRNPWQFRHFTPATYKRLVSTQIKWDSADFLRTMAVIPFDFEIRHKDGSPFSKEEVIEYVEEKLFVTPSFLTHSRNGEDWHVYVLHTLMNGSKKSRKLHDWIQKTLAMRLGCAGGGLGAWHKYAIPYDDIYAVYDYKGEMYVYDINDLRGMAEQTALENNTKIRELKESGLRRPQSPEEVMDSPAFLSLLHGDFLNKVSVDNRFDSRNHAGFTLALILFALFPRMSREEVFDYLREHYYPNVAHAKHDLYTLTELRKSVYSAYTGDYSVSAQWIRDITGLPFGFRLSRSERLSKERGGRNNHQENLVTLLGFLMESPFEGMQKDLIAELVKRGMAERTIQRLLPQLREEGLIEYESGKRSGTIYAITEAGRELMRPKLVVDNVPETVEESGNLGGKKLNRHNRIHKRGALETVNQADLQSMFVHHSRSVRNRLRSGVDPPYLMLLKSAGQADLPDSETLTETLTNSS